MATTAGIYSVDLLDEACHVTPICPGGLKAPVASLLWNAATSEVVAAGGPGGAATISVFKQRLGGW